MAKRTVTRRDFLRTAGGAGAAAALAGAVGSGMPLAGCAEPPCSAASAPPGTGSPGAAGCAAETTGSTGAANRSSTEEASRLPRPTKAQFAWQEAELGVLFSYDLHIFDNVRYRQSANRRTDFKDPNIFDPEELDTDQWVAAAKAAGARFAIVTASHETGFRLWQSEANPFCLKAVRWGGGRRDIVGEFVASCRRAKIAPGIYMGTRWNGHLGVLDYKVTAGSPLTQAAYNRLIEKEVEEICTRYGELFELWFDGGTLGPEAGGPDVLPIFEKQQKNCLFYHGDRRADARWGGSETGTVGYPCWATIPFPSPAAEMRRTSFAKIQPILRHGNPNGRYWCPAMADAPLRNHEWFYEPGDERKIYSLDALKKMYLESVGRNATLIMGVTPDTRGFVPEADVKRLKEWGDWIRGSFQRPLARTGSGGSGGGHEAAASRTAGGPAGRAGAGEDRGSTAGGAAGNGERGGSAARPQAEQQGACVDLVLPRPARIGRLVLEEEITRGERVREYVVEALLSGGWKKICEGSCIGHKRIETFTPVETDRLRLRATRAEAKPLIRNFAAYLRPDQKSSFFVVTHDFSAEMAGKARFLIRSQKEKKE